MALSGVKILRNWLLNYVFEKNQQYKPLLMQLTAWCYYYSHYFLPLYKREELAMAFAKHSDSAVLSPYSTQHNKIDTDDVYASWVAERDLYVFNIALSERKRYRIPFIFATRYTQGLIAHAFVEHAPRPISRYSYYASVYVYDPTEADWGEVASQWMDRRVLSFGRFLYWTLGYVYFLWRRFFIPAVKLTWGLLDLTLTVLWLISPFYIFGAWSRWFFIQKYIAPFPAGVVRSFFPLSYIAAWLLGLFIYLITGLQPNPTVLHSRSKRPGLSAWSVIQFLEFGLAPLRLFFYRLAPKVDRLFAKTFVPNVPFKALEKRHHFWTKLLVRGLRTAYGQTAWGTAFSLLLFFVPHIAYNAKLVRLFLVPKIYRIFLGIFSIIKLFLNLLVGLRTLHQKNSSDCWHVLGQLFIKTSIWLERMLFNWKLNTRYIKGFRRILLLFVHLAAFIFFLLKACWYILRCSLGAFILIYLIMVSLPYMWSFTVLEIIVFVTISWPVAIPRWGRKYLFRAARRLVYGWYWHLPYKLWPMTSNYVKTKANYIIEWRLGAFFAAKLSAFICRIEDLGTKVRQFPWTTMIFNGLTFCLPYCSPKRLLVTILAFIKAGPGFLAQRSAYFKHFANLCSSIVLKVLRALITGLIGSIWMAADSINFFLVNPILGVIKYGYKGWGLMGTCLQRLITHLRDVSRRTHFGKYVAALSTDYPLALTAFDTVCNPLLGLISLLGTGLVWPVKILVTSIIWCATFLIHRCDLFFVIIKRGLINLVLAISGAYDYTRFFALLTRFINCIGGSFALWVSSTIRGVFSSLWYIIKLPVRILFFSLSITYRSVNLGFIYMKKICVFSWLLPISIFSFLIKGFRYFCVSSRLHFDFVVAAFILAVVLAWLHPDMLTYLYSTLPSLGDVSFQLSLLVYQAIVLWALLLLLISPAFLATALLRLPFACVSACFRYFQSSNFIWAIRSSRSIFLAANQQLNKLLGPQRAVHSMRFKHPALGRFVVDLKATMYPIFIVCFLPSLVLLNYAEIVASGSVIFIMGGLSLFILLVYFILFLAGMYCVYFFLITPAIHAFTLAYRAVLFFSSGIILVVAIPAHIIICFVHSIALAVSGVLTEFIWYNLSQVQVPTILRAWSNLIRFILTSLLILLHHDTPALYTRKLLLAGLQVGLSKLRYYMLVLQVAPSVWFDIHKTHHQYPRSVLLIIKLEFLITHLLWAFQVAIKNMHALMLTIYNRHPRASATNCRRIWFYFSFFFKRIVTWPYRPHPKNILAIACFYVYRAVNLFKWAWFTHFQPIPLGWHILSVHKYFINFIKYIAQVYIFVLGLYFDLIIEVVSYIYNSKDRIYLTTVDFYYTKCLRTGKVICRPFFQLLANHFWLIAVVGIAGLGRVGWVLFTAIRGVIAYHYWVGAVGFQVIFTLWTWFITVVAAGIVAGRTIPRSGLALRIGIDNLPETTRTAYQTVRWVVVRAAAVIRSTLTWRYLVVPLAAKRYTMAWLILKWTYKKQAGSIYQICLQEVRKWKYYWRSAFREESLHILKALKSDKLVKRELANSKASSFACLLQSAFGLFWTHFVHTNSIHLNYVTNTVVFKSIVSSAYIAVARTITYPAEAVLFILQFFIRRLSTPKLTTKDYARRDSSSTSVPYKISTTHGSQTLVSSKLLLNNNYTAVVCYSLVQLGFFSTVGILLFTFTRFVLTSLTASVVTGQAAPLSVLSWVLEVFALLGLALSSISFVGAGLILGMLQAYYSLNNFIWIGTVTWRALSRVWHPIMLSTLRYFQKLVSHAYYRQFAFRLKQRALLCISQLFNPRIWAMTILRNCAQLLETLAFALKRRTHQNDARLKQHRGEMVNTLFNDTALRRHVSTVWHTFFKSPADYVRDFLTTKLTTIMEWLLPTKLRPKVEDIHINSLWKGADKVLPGVQPKLVFSGFWYKDIWEQQLATSTLFGATWAIFSRAIICIYNVPLHFIWPAIVESLFWVFMQLAFPVYFLMFWWWTFTWLFLNMFRRISFMHKPKTQYWPMADIITMRNDIKWHLFYIVRNNSLMLDVPYLVRLVGPYFERRFKQFCQLFPVKTLVTVTERISQLIITVVRKPFIDPILTHIVNKYLKTAFYIVAQAAIFAGTPFKHRKYKYYTYLTVVLTEMKLKYKMLKHTFRWVVFLYLLRRAWKKTIEFILEFLELIVRSVPYLFAALLVDLIDWVHWLIFIAPSRLVSAFTRGFIWNFSYSVRAHEISSLRPVWNTTGWRIALNVVLKFPRVIRQVLGLVLLGGIVPLLLRRSLGLVQKFNLAIRQILNSTTLAQSSDFPDPNLISSLVSGRAYESVEVRARSIRWSVLLMQRSFAKKNPASQVTDLTQLLHSKLLFYTNKRGVFSYNWVVNELYADRPSFASRSAAFIEGYLYAPYNWLLARCTIALVMITRSAEQIVYRNRPKISGTTGRYIPDRSAQASEIKVLLRVLFWFKKIVVHFLGSVCQLKLVKNLTTLNASRLGYHRLRFNHQSTRRTTVLTLVSNFSGFFLKLRRHLLQTSSLLLAAVYWKLLYQILRWSINCRLKVVCYWRFSQVLVIREAANLVIQTPGFILARAQAIIRHCRPLALTVWGGIASAYREFDYFCYSPNVLLTKHWISSFLRTPYYALLFLSLDLPGFLFKKLFFLIGIKGLRYRGLIREILALADVSKTTLTRYPELVIVFQQFVGNCIKRFFFYFANHVWALVGWAWRILLGPISLNAEIEGAITKALFEWNYPRPEVYIPIKYKRLNVIAKLILYVITAWDYVPLVVDYYTKQVLKHYPEARDRLIRRHHDFVREFALIFSRDNRKVWHFLHPNRPNDMKYARNLFNSQIYKNRVKRKRIARLVDFQFLTVSRWDGRLKPTVELSLLPSLWRSTIFDFSGGRLNIHSSAFWSIWYFLEGLLGYIWWFMLRPTVMVFTIVFDHLLNNYYHVPRYIPRVLIILPFKVYFMAPIKAFITVYRHRVDKRVWPLVVGFCIAAVLGWYGLLAWDEFITRRWGRWYPIAAASALPLTSWTILIDPLFTIHALAYGLGMSIFYQTVIDPWKGSFWKVTVATIIIVWVAFLHPYNHDDLEVPNFVVFMAYRLLHILRFDLEMRHGWGYLFCVLFVGLTPLYVLQFSFHIPRHSYIREPDVQEYYRRQTIRFITYTRPFYTYWFSFMVIYYNLVFYAHSPDSIFMQLTPLEALRQFIAFFGLQSELEYYNLNDLGLDFTEDWGQHMEPEDFFPYTTAHTLFSDRELWSRPRDIPYVPYDWDTALLVPNPQSLMTAYIPFTDYCFHSFHIWSEALVFDYGEDWWRFMDEGPEWRQYFRPKVRKSLRRSNPFYLGEIAMLYEDTLPRNILHLFPSLYTHNYTIGEFSPVWEHWASDPREESSVTWWDVANGGWEAPAIEASAIAQMDVTYLWDGVLWNPELDHHLLINKIDRNFGAQFMFANWDTFKFFSGPYRADYMIFWRWDSFEPWAWDWVSMGWKTINFIRKWFLPIDITRWLIENRYEIRNEIVLMYLLGKAEAHRYFLSLILHPVQYEILISSNRI